MYYSTELRLIRATFEKCGIITVVTEKETLLEQIKKDMPFELENAFLSETFLNDIKPATVYHHSDLFFCKYIFFLLPDNEKIMVM